MTSGPMVTATSTSRPESSGGVDAVAALAFFPCGDGDTILLRMPGPAWALIDCNLTRDGAAKELLFKFFVDHGVDRLDYVILTHHDTDHFHGMQSVLEWFTREGRTLGVFCDPGLTDAQIKAFQKRYANGGAESELKRLIDAVRAMRAGGALSARWQLGKRTIPLESADRADPTRKARLLAIAPDGEQTRDAGERAATQLARRVGVTTENNLLSIVLVLEATDATRTAVSMLCGDCEALELGAAVVEWMSTAKLTGPGPGAIPQVVKVSHHGSIDSHSEEVVGCKPPGVEGFAVVSAGEGKHHPARRVVEDYLKGGWRVLLTHPRRRALIERGTRDTPLGLLPSRRAARYHADARVVEVKMLSEKDVSFGPPDCEVGSGDLAAFGVSVRGSGR